MVPHPPPPCSLFQIKQKPIPVLRGKELPLDADVSMLPLDQQVAHLENIRKRLFAKLSEMERAAAAAAAATSNATAKAEADAAASRAQIEALEKQLAALPNTEDPSAAAAAAVAVGLHGRVLALVSGIQDLAQRVASASDPDRPPSPAAAAAATSLAEAAASDRAGVPAKERPLMDLLNVDTELVGKVTSAMVSMRVVAPPPREIRVEVPVPQAAGAGAGAGAGARVQEKPPQQRDTPPPKRKVVVDEPPKEPVHVPRVPGVGELEVAEDLVNRSEELEDARKKMEVRRNMMGKEVDEINKQLRDKALDPRTRKALQHRRERRVAAIEDMDERMKALLAERERNLLLVMNAYARVHKIAKVKGELANTSSVLSVCLPG